MHVLLRWALEYCITECHSSYLYRWEENFRQLNISYFKFTFGFNFRIVRYACIYYSIEQKFSFGFNFLTNVNLKSIWKNQPYGMHYATCSMLSKGTTVLRLIDIVCVCSPLTCILCVHRVYRCSRSVNSTSLPWLFNRGQVRDNNLRAVFTKNNTVHVASYM